MTKKLANIFTSAALPAMVVVASEGGADNEEMTISKFSDATSGQPVAVLSNLSAPHSPITGEAMTVPENNAEVDTASVNTKETLGSLVCIASCVACSHDTHTPKELAAELDNQTIYCMNCGEPVTAFYDGDLLDESDVADSDDDDDSTDDSDDVTDAIADDGDDSDDDDASEDTDDSTDDEDGDTEDDTSEDSDDSTDEEDDSVDGTDSTDDDKVATDGTDDASTAADDSTDDSDSTTDADPSDDGDASSDDDTSDDGSDDNTEDDSDSGDDNEDGDSTDDGDETASTHEVVVASVVNYNGESIRFAATSDTARYEAFLGDNHIGHLLRDEASANVKNYFGKVDLLRNVFASTYHKNAAEIASGELKSLVDFGFKPAKFTIPLDKVVASEIQAGVSAAEATLDEKVKEVTEAVVATTKIAIAGINKGMFDGPNFIGELAKLLKRAGVQHAEEAAARFVEEYTEPFLKAVVEKAAELRNQNTEFVRGIAVSVEKASFQRPSVNKQDDYLTTSALLPTQEQRREPAKPAPFVEKASTEKPASTMQNPWKRYGTHRG